MTASDRVLAQRGNHHEPAPATDLRVEELAMSTEVPRKRVLNNKTVLLVTDPSRRASSFEDTFPNGFMVQYLRVIALSTSAKASRR